MIYYNQWQQPNKKGQLAIQYSPAGMLSHPAEKRKEP
jgi:hypothetical protein